MPNFFDQFDSQENFFDKFDSPKKEKKPAVEPTRPTPGILERMGGHILQSASGSMPAAYLRKQRYNEAKTLEEKKRIRDERAAQLRDFDEMPGVADGSRESHEGFLNTFKDFAHLAAVGGGQLIGGTVDPLNLVPVGKGATLLRTLLKGAVVGAPTGAMSELYNQMADIELGARKDFDIDELMIAAGLGAGFQGGANAAFNHGNFKLQTEHLGPSGEALDPKVEVAKAQAAKLKAQAVDDAAKAEMEKFDKHNFFDQFDEPASPYPPIKDEFKPTDDILDTSYLDEGQALPNIEQFPETHFPEPEVRTPLPELDPMVHQDIATAERPPADPNALPEIDPAFRYTEPIDTAAAPLDSNAPRDMLPDISTRVEPGDMRVPSGEEAFQAALWEIKNNSRNKNYPKLKKEFQTEEPVTTVQDEPFPEFGEGFGPDVSGSVPETAPHMPGRLVDIATAEGEPGTHGMEFSIPHIPERNRQRTPGQDGTFTDFQKPEFRFIGAAFRDAFTGKVFETGNMHRLDKLPPEQRNKAAGVNEAGFVGSDGKFYTRQEAANRLREVEVKSDVHGADVHSSNLFDRQSNPETGRGTAFQTNDAAIADILNAKTLGDALRAVVKYGTRNESAIADAILSKNLDNDINFKLTASDKFRGSFNLHQDGSRDVLFDPFAGGDGTTIIHETIHAHTNDAFYSVEAGRATPEQKAYVDKIQKLFDVAKRELKGKVPDDWLANIREFNAYGLTEPRLQLALDKIPFRGTTLWARFVRALSSFFGVKDPSVFRKILEATKDWEKIQTPDSERGALYKALVQARKAKSKDTTDLERVPEEKADAFNEKLKAHHGFFETIPELVNHIKTKGLDDLSHSVINRGFFTMQNQLAMMQVKNPVVSFVFNHLFDGLRKSEARMLRYDKVTKDIIKWGEKNPKETVGFFRELIQLNAKPELKAKRAELEAGGIDAIKAHFAEKGVSPETVDKFMPMVEVMRDVHKADSISLGKSKRELAHEPLYFPLGRGGPYRFVVTDPNGVVRFAQGYDSLREAKKAMKVMNESKEEGWTVGPVERTDPSRRLPAALEIALTEGNPEWLQKTATSSYTKRAEYIRNFELGRNTATEVGGYLGEVAPKTDGEFNELAKDFLKSFSHRVRESHHLENASSAVELIHGLALDPHLFDNYPGTRAWLNSELSRHIGLDISKMGETTDAFLTGLSNKIGKGLTHIDAALNNYKVEAGDNVVRPDLAKAVTQGYTYFVSLAKIGLVPHVLAANLVQNATIGLDGARSALRLGVPVDHAMAAQAKQMLYLVSRYLPDSIRPEQFKAIQKKMEQAKNEGILDPHGREDYSTVENAADRAANLGVVDKVVQAPRNLIEQLTNYNAVLYYNFFVDSAFPELKGAARDRVVYNLSRSFTGDYSQPANLFMFEKAGVLGHTGSNFARWRFNRTSRYLDDLAMAANVREYGPRGLMPFVVSLALGSIFAGAMGTVGLVEYEALRRWGANTGAWDLKPLAQIIDEVLPEEVKGGMRTYLERGAVTAFSDWTAQQFGQESGPDISTSIRESSFLEPPGVAVSYAFDAVKAMALLGKRGLSSDTFQEYVNSMPEGVPKKVMKAISEDASMGFTNEETRTFIKALPTVTQEAFKAHAEAGINKLETPEGNLYVIPEQRRDQGNVIRNEFQQNLAMWGGLKTTEENRMLEGKQVHKYEQRQAEERLTKLKNGLIDNVSNPRIVNQNATEILSKYGQAALERTLDDLVKQREETMATDYIGLQTLAASRVRDPVAMQRAIERIEAMLRVARPRTFSDR